MLDRYILPRTSSFLSFCARLLHARDITANRVTLFGLCCGLVTLPLLAVEQYIPALFCICLNRFLDGVDGALARIQGASDDGAYLDIVCDFIFYAVVVLGFALAAPGENALAADLLLAAFMGTSSSFLAFAVFAERRSLPLIVYPSKGFYYLGGLAEGTETICFFILFCLLPQWFPALALFFALLCLVTTVVRVFFAYRLLQEPHP
ncbi:CDP-alcohol phosphatidyltransferase family protein [Desulfotalea psychrophila]|uniref:Conserved hypothetical membrane protein n=1 Tax=Desulfotalea psychrophila (strain LSv54 / DSM 12343) TaxID=177439 RepID=Q6ARH9_DESPS|nr:CDP-alcohol phosphatidyltransferase family protein [Desulfotalea psychrophila]CAG35046.1 conserved hypothetical membrane protein [Desulfotalea psychrophila LSv54]